MEETNEEVSEEVTKILSRSVNISENLNKVRNFISFILVTLMVECVSSEKLRLILFSLAPRKAYLQCHIPLS